MPAPSRRSLLIGALAAAFAPPAWASRAEALALYRDGRFLNAADAAQASSDFVLAARALLAQVVVAPRSADADRLVARALSAGEAALSAAPNSVDARLQLAAALGMKGRRSSIRAALRAGYATRGKRLIDEALRRAPDEPWGRALLGGWHLEILRRGGRAGALAFGAHFSDGVENFERARALAPADLVIATHYGVALIALNPIRHATRAAAQFNAANACAARDAFERFIQAQAARLAHVLAAEGPQAAQRAAAAAFP